MIKIVLRRIIDYPYLRFRQGKILDLGCGDGSLMTGDCVGIDNDSKTIMKAYTKGKRVILANAEELSISSEFDTVTMIYMLHHTKNPEKVLHTAYQSLKPGGRALIVEASKAGLRQLALGSHKFERYLSQEWLTNKLNEIGFKIEKQFTWFGRTVGPLFAKALITIAKK